MSEDRNALLAKAAAPRRAVMDDAGTLSRLFAAAFVNDPVFDWIARPGAKRAAGMERFFFWLLKSRAIPFGEVWMSEGAAAAWLPPEAPASPGGFAEQMKLIPLFIRLCGFPRLMRGSAMADAMEKNHPAEPHFYLAFIAVAPRLQGMGLGGALLEATVKRADDGRVPAYLENSNPEHQAVRARGLRHQTKHRACRRLALIAMWRPARGAQGSNSESQYK